MCIVVYWICVGYNLRLDIGLYLRFEILYFINRKVRKYNHGLDSSKWKMKEVFVCVVVVYTTE